MLLEEEEDRKRKSEQQQGVPHREDPFRDPTGTAA